MTAIQCTLYSDTRKSSVARRGESGHGGLLCAALGCVCRPRSTAICPGDLLSAYRGERSLLIGSGGAWCWFSGAATQRPCPNALHVLKVEPMCLDRGHHTREHLESIWQASRGAMMAAGSSRRQVGMELAQSCATRRPPPATSADARRPFTAEARCAHGRA